MPRLCLHQWLLLGLMGSVVLNLECSQQKHGQDRWMCSTGIWVELPTAGFIKKKQSGLSNCSNLILVWNRNQQLSQGCIVHLTCAEFVGTVFCWSDVLLKLLALWAGVYSFIFQCSETLMSEALTWKTHFPASLDGWSRVRRHSVRSPAQVSSCCIIDAVFNIKHT